jgi:hypothetical protein
MRPIKGSTTMKTPMKSVGGAVMLGVLAFVVPACSRGLSREEAKAVIEENSLIRQTDAVSVDGISSTNEAEAVVRATIAGATTNLKFRRFDSGWTWEFVETKAGGWVAPDVAIGQIREEKRTIAAVAWAEQHKDAYTKTAETMWLVSVHQVPSPGERENYDLYLKLKKMRTDQFAKLAKAGNSELDEVVAVLTSDRWPDAWGSDIQVHLSDKDSSILVSSLGPDKTQGTDDDVLLLNIYRRGYEDGRQVWHHDRHWRVPEGLGDSIKNFDKEDDKLEYSKVVKP